MRHAAARAAALAGDAAGAFATPGQCTSSKSSCETRSRRSMPSAASSAASSLRVS
jgi:hypothetical protein